MVAVKYNPDNCLASFFGQIIRLTLAVQFSLGQICSAKSYLESGVFAFIVWVGERGAVLCPVRGMLGLDLVGLLFKIMLCFKKLIWIYRYVYCLLCLYVYRHWQFSFFPILFQFLVQSLSQMFHFYSTLMNKYGTLGLLVW